ncbi:hypothetical protein CP978_29230 [Streptomyces nodosus]|uniref:Type VII secretion system protein EssD-like domain-containing protein n=2 Tax=Streptomyces nodosus TaxID=40318 RepID=A0A5P2W9P7_9ACTN|nr:hypothetical protein CP978_29230 [Streptomyces nodosus]
MYAAGSPADNNMGADGKPIYNRTHITADTLHGEPRSKNLLTGFNRTNKSGMRRCESKTKKQLQGNNPALYSGLPNYPRQCGYDTEGNSHDSVHKVWEIVRCDSG